MRVRCYFSDYEIVFVTFWQPKAYFLKKGELFVSLVSKHACVNVSGFSGSLGSIIAGVYLGQQPALQLPLPFIAKPTPLIPMASTVLISSVVVGRSGASTASIVTSVRHWDGRRYFMMTILIKSCRLAVMTKISTQNVLSRRLVQNNHSCVPQ